MTENKSKSKSTVILLSILLSGLIAVYGYFQWEANTKGGALLQTEQTVSLEVENNIEKDNSKNAIDTAASTKNQKNSTDKRVVIDLSDPVSPIPPYDPAPPDSILKMKEKEVEPLVSSALPIDTTPRVYEYVHQMPSYEGGDGNLAKFIAQNIVYPTVDKENGRAGTVYVGFIVEPDGSVSDIAILRTFSKSAGQEAIRVTKLLKWNPGTQKGKPVRVKMKIPIRFRLD